MKVWAHTIVKNEEKYVWFCLMSVIDHVDKILVYDTGSTDRTSEIVKLIKNDFPGKIIFRKVGEVDINEFTSVRQEMLSKTKADWVWIADADEVWWDAPAAAHRRMMESGKLESIVVHYRNLIGDIYHVQPESAGKYKIDGVEGHLTIRGISTKIPGLTVSKPHGVQGFYDKNDVLIQERDERKRKHLKGVGYLHFTHLPRGGSRESDRKVPKREMKLKKELGNPLPYDYYYPEVFFMSRPKIVPSPWVKRSLSNKLASTLYEFPRKIKRKFWKGGLGY